MIGNKATLGNMQSDFYREKYRKFLRLLLMSVSLMVILIGVIIYLIIFKAAPQYYADTTEGVVLPLKVKS